MLRRLGVALLVFFGSFAFGAAPLGTTPPRPVATAVHDALSRRSLAAIVAPYGGSRVRDMRQTSRTVRNAQPPLQPNEVAAAILECRLRTRLQFDQLPAAIRHAELVLLAGLRMETEHERWRFRARVQQQAEGIPRTRAPGEFLTDWDNEHDFPKNIVHQMPNVVAAAILHRVLRNDQHQPQFSNLPVALQYDPIVLAAALDRRLLGTSVPWGALPETVRSLPGVVAAAIRCGYLSSRREWDLLPDGMVAAPGAVLPATFFHLSPHLFFPLPGQHWVRFASSELQEHPEVVAAAIERSLIRTREHFGFLPAEVRTAPPVVAAGIAKELISAVHGDRWDDLPDPLRVVPDVVRAAIVYQLLSTKEEYRRLPPHIRAGNVAVVEAAIRCQLLAADEREPLPWERLPADVRLHPTVVTAALERRLLSTAAQWERLPAWLQSTPLVVRAAISAHVLSAAHWDRLLDPVRAHADLVAKAIEYKLLTTPAQWDAVAEWVKRDRRVLLTAIVGGLFALEPFQQRGEWERLPEEVREDPQFVVAALWHEVIRTRQQWNLLSDDVRSRPEVQEWAFARSTLV